MNNSIKAAIQTFTETELEFKKAQNTLHYEVYDYLLKNKLNIKQLRTLKHDLPLGSIARGLVNQKYRQAQIEREKQIKIQTELRNASID